MRIGLNLLFLIPAEVGGTETYSTSLIAAIHQLDQTNQYFLFINKESIEVNFPEGDNFHRILCPFNARNRAIRFLWEQFVLPWQAAALRLDLLHSLGYICPLILPCKNVVTIHDLNFLNIPESFTSLTRFVQKFFVTASARKADRIIAVSNFVRDEITKHLRVNGSKISVVWEAPKNRTKGASPGPTLDELRGRFGITKPYIFAFSSISPHKNIQRLISAFQEANENLENSYQLVIAGHWPNSRDQQIIESSPLDNISLTGYLSDVEVSVLLSNASLFAFPSLYEGFGLPVLEAMSMGVPVICSNAASLPEIAGHAALTFNPLKIEEISDSIVTVLNDDSNRRRIAKKGIENCKRFSWNKAAQETLTHYHSLMNVI